MSVYSYMNVVQQRNVIASRFAELTKNAYKNEVNATAFSVGARLKALEKIFTELFEAEFYLDQLLNANKRDNLPSIRAVSINIK